MERILQYQVTEGESGLRIQELLKRKGYSAQNIIQLKKTSEGILLNGVWAYVNQFVTVGDLLEIRIVESASSEKIPPVYHPLSIVYEDEDLMVIDKPPHMPIHPSMDNYENSLANAVAWYFKEQNIPFVFRCVNRLDKDTSGLTIIAKHMLSANLLSQMIANKSLQANTAFRAQKAVGDRGSQLPVLQREYLAIVRGIPSPKEGTIDAPIARKDASIIERVVDASRGERAVTHYRVLMSENGHSLVALQLETGRTHQIRVHMKHLGYPLVGDGLYNPDMEYITRQALHSHRLTFTHPITGDPMEFVSPLPEDMAELLQK